MSEPRCFVCGRPAGQANWEVTAGTEPICDECYWHLMDSATKNAHHIMHYRTGRGPGNPPARGDSCVPPHPPLPSAREQADVDGRTRTPVVAVYDSNAGSSASNRADKPPAPPKCEVCELYLCELYGMEDARWILESHINGLHQELATFEEERDFARGWVAELRALVDDILRDNYDDKEWTRRAEAALARKE